MVDFENCGKFLATPLCLLSLIEIFNISTLSKIMKVKDKILKYLLVWQVIPS